MKEIIKIYLVFFIGFLSSCISKQNDIYNYVEKGTSIDVDLLKKAKQLIVNNTNNDVIILFDISQNELTSNLHLLFFDNKLIFYGACYYPAEKVDSISNNVIYGVLNKHRYNRKSWFRDNLPVNYKISFIDINNSSAHTSNKIIKKIEVQSNSIKLYVLKSENLFDGLRWDKSKPNLNYLNHFSIKDTIIYNLSDLCFNYNDFNISSRQITKQGHLVWDKMIISDISNFNKFYEDLLLYLNTLKK